MPIKRRISLINKTQNSRRRRSCMSIQNRLCSRRHFFVCGGADQPIKFSAKCVEFEQNDCGNKNGSTPLNPPESKAKASSNTRPNAMHLNVGPRHNAAKSLSHTFQVSRSANATSHHRNCKPTDNSDEYYETHPANRRLLARVTWHPKPVKHLFRAKNSESGLVSEKSAGRESGALENTGVFPQR